MLAATVQSPPKTEELTSELTSKLFTSRQLAVRHPHLLSEHRLAWATRHRRVNGLSAAGAIFESPCGGLLIHEPAFLAWFLGLSRSAKPRRLRTRASVPVLA
jgi:hypothetical protein